MDARSKELRSLLAAPNVDILRVRHLSRLGLPDTATRAIVWPLLLGLTSADLAEDKKALAAFTVKHNNAKGLSATFDAARLAFLDARREHEARKVAWIAQKREEFKNSTPTEEPASEMSWPIPDEDEWVFPEPTPVHPDTPSYPTKYWDQVTKDVDRSLWKQVPDIQERTVKRDQLHRIICAVLCTTTDFEGKQLHYFQGYHDIASVCLLTCGEDVGFSLLRRLSQTYIRDQMQERIDYVTGLLNILFPLVTSIDSNIGRFLGRSQIQPYAALPWVMTWFSHVLENQPLSERMFDLFLASSSWMPLYLAAALVVYMADNGLYSCPCEFSEVHNFVSKFSSRNDIPWETLIKDALKYFVLFPPQSISSAPALPDNAYILKYPYSWVPANEVLARPSTISSTHIGLGLLVVGSALALGIAVFGVPLLPK